ncbi:MAG TPA: secretion protein HlyD [Candidatus Gallacutalibacter stercoravium]|nr:secretion protein HlyD [Candidatus Gallacutalibacter stercoravium]
MGSRIIQRVATIVLALLLLLYVAFQAYSCAYSQLVTETAVYTTIEDVVTVTGYFVREETPITSDTQGVLAYSLDEGDKVAQGGQVAQVYANQGDASAQEEMKKLQAEIEQLQSLSAPADSFAATPETLDKQISQDLNDWLADVRGEEYTSVLEQQNNLLYLMNERQVITQEVTGFEERIAALQTQLQTLQSSHGGSLGAVTAPAAGYFVSQLDGYESSFSYSGVQDLTVEQIKAGPVQGTIPDNAVGKIITKPDWYLVCVLSADDAVRLQANMDSYDISLRLPFVTNESVPVNEIWIDQQDMQSEAAVVLKCNYMNGALAGARSGPVQIVMASYQGIRVSAKATHMGQVVTEVQEDEAGNEVATATESVLGVYVQYGGELQFKEILPLYTGNGYVICKANPEEGELKNINQQTVTLYDEVVVEGTDLYDGKMVE